MNSLGFPDYSIVGTPDGSYEAEITFNSNTADANGSFWFLDGDVQGWDSPDMRVTMLPKIGNDVDAEGEIPGDLHYRGRSLVLKLYCEAESEVARQNSRLLLAQACNTDACVFTVNEEAPKFMDVVRSGNTNQGKLTIAEHGYPGKAGATVPFDSVGAGYGFPVGTTVYVFETTIELYAADPFKYAVEPSTETLVDGTVSFSNPGSYPSMRGSVHLTATGGGTGPIDIETPERYLQLLVPAVPAAAPVLSPIPENTVVDMYNHLIYDGDVGPSSNYYYLRNMQTPWLRIPAGETTLTCPGQEGYLTYYPAWL